MSRLSTAGDTITHYENDDIPVFHPELVNFELEINKSPDEVELIDVQMRQGKNYMPLCKNQHIHPKTQNRPELSESPKPKSTTNAAPKYAVMLTWGNRHLKLTITQF